MLIRQLLTREFEDAVTGEVALLILKTTDGSLTIGISKREDGDVQVTLTAEVEEALRGILLDREAAR